MHETGSPLLQETPDLGVERPFGDRLTAAIADTLDAESHAVVESVLYRDTADAREGVARRFIANALTELKRLTQAQDAVGTLEQMHAIKRTGACTDARFWLIAAWCLVFIDAAFWFFATAQVFSF